MPFAVNKLLKPCCRAARVGLSELVPEALEVVVVLDEESCCIRLCKALSILLDTPS